MLPATRSNLGVFATGQSYEQMLIRMRAHPLAEVREYADLMLVELRKVIPAFLKRVDLPDRGVAWSRYLSETRRPPARSPGSSPRASSRATREAVTLTDYDPLGEEDRRGGDVRVVVAPGRPAAVARAHDERGRARRGASRLPRRAREPATPASRAFERTGYRFDVLCDYGAFRDLQRHASSRSSGRRSRRRTGSTRRR